MSVALQKAIRNALISDEAVVALVPPSNIFDRLGRPEVFPSIIMGQGQDVAANLTLVRQHVRTFTTLHVWDRSGSLVAVQKIASAIRRALHGKTPALEMGVCVDFAFESVHFLKDPDGESAHAVVTFEALIEEPV